mmetsp:Transcript_14116/g.20876  ORF Transcript_14116/g.20876 Transcript_14116/m.20876 type:complete len:253 (-) Transcript_14116:57-815(-)
MAFDSMDTAMTTTTSTNTKQRSKSKRTYDEAMEEHFTESTSYINTNTSSNQKWFRTDIIAPANINNDENLPNNGQQRQQQHEYYNAYNTTTQQHQHQHTPYCIECECEILIEEMQCEEQGGCASQCDRCQHYYCRSCPGGAYMATCDGCQSWLCLHCSEGSFLPDENNNKLCKRCRPWWQQNVESMYACCNCGSSLNPEQQRQCHGCRACVCTRCVVTAVCSNTCSREDCGDVIYYCPNCNCIAAAAAAGHY